MKFDEWFEKQFGKEPHPRLSLFALEDRADSLRRLLRTTEAQIHARENWLDRRGAALYAWNIKEENKK